MKSARSQSLLKNRAPLKLAFEGRVDRVCAREILVVQLLAVKLLASYGRLGEVLAASANGIRGIRQQCAGEAAQGLAEGIAARRTQRV